MNKRAAEIKRLRNKADRLLQQIVKAARPRCEHCGKPTQAAHHFYTKASSAELRYDLQNMIALCNGCHLQHHKGSPDIHVKIMMDRGPEWYDDLFSRKSTVRKRNREYYIAVITQLEGIFMTEVV